MTLIAQITDLHIRPSGNAPQLRAYAVADSAELAPSGMEGGFQLQVASYRDQADADKLVEDLRKRGHRAFRQAAYVPERGLWQRVRIGPFKNKFEAVEYKAKFERAERLTPFLVDGWSAPAYLVAGQTIPRRDRGTALLCPFDPLIFFRPRVQRLAQVEMIGGAVAEPRQREATGFGAESGGGQVHLLDVIADRGPAAREPPDVRVHRGGRFGQLR